jgi:hypothetical protein
MAYYDQNRYSFSGSDVAAFAYYGHTSAPSEHDIAQLRIQKARLAAINTDSVVTAAGSEMSAVSGSGRALAAESTDTTMAGPQELGGERRYIEALQSDINRLEEKIRAGTPVHLESLATVSISIHEPKAPVRALGHRGTKGFARSVRTIAGTMVLLVVEDHPLRKLAYQPQSKFNPSDSSFSLDMDSLGQGGYRQPGTLDTYPGNTRISTLLKPFDMILRYQSEVLPKSKVNFTVSANEAVEAFREEHPSETNWPDPVLDGTNIVKDAQGRSRAARRDRRLSMKDPYLGVSSVAFNVPKVATMMIEGIEIISEGITTSVNDMVTEVVIQFVAQDVKQLSTIHESSILSYRPDELPPEVFAQLRGEAESMTSQVRGDIKDGMKAQETALKSRLSKARATRRVIREAQSQEGVELPATINGRPPGYDVG